MRDGCSCNLVIDIGLPGMSGHLVLSKTSTKTLGPAAKVLDGWSYQKCLCVYLVLLV